MRRLFYLPILACVLSACASPAKRCDRVREYRVNGTCARRMPAPMPGERPETRASSAFEGPGALATRRGGEARVIAPGVYRKTHHEAISASRPPGDDIRGRLDALEEEQFFNSMDSDEIQILNHLQP